MTPGPLLAVPNVSAGRDGRVLAAIAAAFREGGARLLDLHRDPDHDRAVFTLAGAPGGLAEALAAGVREAVARVDVHANRGVHPHVGAVDVVPLVHLDPDRPGPACAEALLAAELIGALGVPVLLYGSLTGAPPRTRAALRRGGPDALALRLASGELRADFGPSGAHPTAGATLLAARPPLVAFNLELAPPATLADARRAAAAVREGGADGLPGVRALGLELAARGGVAQVSCNVEDHRAVPLAHVLAAVEAHARVREAELVGLAPAAAFAGWPVDVPVRGRRTLEDALA